MPHDRIYHLFISHAWAYNDSYYRLVKLLDAAPDFRWRDYSVPEHDPLAGGAELSEQLRGQLKPASVMLIFAGMYVNHREWIQYELELARELGKPIIGVLPRGQRRVPEQVRAAATEMVRWNTRSIVSAVRAHAR
ncbi:MAG: TIR domain-containing protein [Alphaproteobacteria bacterium]|nr:TIR domain-containing protein [Alphaproteobacteria bacterium]